MSAAVVSQPERRDRGVVKFFNFSKGWGFFEVDGKPDVFVHVNELKPLRCNGIFPGDVATFVIRGGRDGKGPRAFEIQLIHTGVIAK